MKFTLGFITGVAVGGFLASNMTEQQRAKTGQAASRAVSRVQESTVVQAVTKNVGQVSGAASERVAEVVDTAGSTLTDVIERSDPVTTTDQPSNQTANRTNNRTNNQTTGV